MIPLFSLSIALLLPAYVGLISRLISSITDKSSLYVEPCDTFTGWTNPMDGGPKSLNAGLKLDEDGRDGDGTEEPGGVWLEPDGAGAIGL